MVVVVVADVVAVNDPSRNPTAGGESVWIRNGEEEGDDDANRGGGGSGGDSSTPLALLVLPVGGMRWTMMGTSAGNAGL